jgi:hypothetical protein
MGEFGGDGSITDSIEPFVSDACAQIDAINAAKPGSLAATFWSYTTAFTAEPGPPAISINATTGVASPAGRMGNVVYNWMNAHA